MAGRAATRPLVVALPLEDIERLRIIGTARRGQPDPAEIVAHLVRTWLDGPGHGELLTVLTRWTKGPEKPAVVRQIRGQMDLLDAVPGGRDHIASTGT